MRTGRVYVADTICLREVAFPRTLLVGESHIRYVQPMTCTTFKLISAPQQD